MKSPVAEAFFCSACARQVEREDPDEFSFEVEEDGEILERRRFCSLSCAGSFLTAQGVSERVRSGDKKGGFGHMVAGLVFQAAHLLGVPGSKCLKCKETIDETGSCKCVSTKGRKKD